MEMKDTTVSKLKRNPQCGQYSNTYLFDILHLVALFALGGGWVFYLSRTHQDIGLAESAFGHVLQVDIETQHEAFDVVDLIYTQVELSEGR